MSDTGGEKQARAEGELSKDELMTPKPYDRTNMILETTPIINSKNTPEKLKQKSRLSHLKQNSLKKSRPNEDLNVIYDD